MALRAALLTLLIGASRACTSHNQCGLQEYCTTGNACIAGSLCASAGNSIDGGCPTIGIVAVCTVHTDCNQLTQYCDNTGQCFVCAACSIVNDAIDGSCPTWCGSTLTTVVPASAGKTKDASSSGGGGGDGDNSTAVAAAVSTALILMALILVGMYIYFRRQDKQQPLEKEGVRLRDVLTLQQAADVAVRRMSQATIRTNRQSHAQHLEYEDEMYQANPQAPASETSQHTQRSARRDSKIELVRTFSLDYRELGPMIDEAKTARKVKKLLELADMGQETSTDDRQEPSPESADVVPFSSSSSEGTSSNQQRSSDGFPTSLSLLGWPTRANDDDAESTGEGIAIEWEDDALSDSEEQLNTGIKISRRGETSL